MALKVSNYQLRVEQPEIRDGWRFNCTWCDTPKDGKGPITDEERASGKVSDGMCDDCVEVQRAKLRELQERDEPRP